MAKLPERRTALEEELGLDLAIETRGGNRLTGARRAIRWLLRACSWEALEEQIAEVLGCYEPPTELVLPGVVTLLAEARLKGRTGLAILELPRTDAGSEALTDLCEVVGSDGILRFQIGGDPTFVVAHGSLPRVRDALAVEVCTIGPLAEIILSWGPGDELDKRFAYGLVVDLLEHADVQVHRDHWTSTIASLLVPQHHAPLAVGILDRVPPHLASFLQGGSSSRGSLEAERGAGGGGG